MPPANTLVRWVDEIAFASVVQARPCPTFGRPVRHGVAPSTTARYCSANPSDPTSRWAPCPPQFRRGGSRSTLAVSSFRLRARVGVSIPATCGRRGITPAFGYGPPHPGAGGTSTLLTSALPGAHYTPLRHPLAFGSLPGVTGYRVYLAPAISRRGEEGFSSCSACPCHRAVATTPPKWVSRVNQVSAAHAAFAFRLQARPSEYTLEATSAFTSRYGPMTRNLPKGDLVDRLQKIGFPPPCYPSYGAPDSCPGGICLPLNRPALAGHTTRRADFRHRALQWNHAARTRVPGHDQRAGLASRGTKLAPLRRPAGASSGLLTPWRQRPFGSSPSLVHVMTSGISAHLRGTRPSATPVSLLPFAIAVHLRSLPSAGITRFPRCRVGGGAPRGRWPPSAAHALVSIPGTLVRCG